MKMNLVFASLLFVGLLGACLSEERSNVSANSKNEKDSPVKIQSNSVSRIAESNPPDSSKGNPSPTSGNGNLLIENAAVISGLKNYAGRLKNYFDSASWKENQGFLDSSWTRLDKNRITRIKTWRDKNLQDINANTKMVFYPFSGPDFLTAFTFFPNADKFVLIGLENIGKLPEVRKMNTQAAADYVQGFKKALGDIFNKSYFITKNMSRDFNYKSLYGTLSLMSFFIMRTGNQITSLDYVVLEDKQIKEVPYTSNFSQTKKPFGVKIGFVNQGKPKTAYYFRYDLSNKKFNDTAVFYKYLNQMNVSTTYIKSASYLLHNNFMTNLLNFILKKSTAVMEDDTGIPYKYFASDKQWNVRLYGEYVKPVSDFKWLNLQKDLNERCHKDSLSIPKLPFHLGYHWGTNKDILLVCRKGKGV